MKDLQQGIVILNDTILHKRTHQDYKRVTELAEKYLKLFTGEEIETLLKPFAKREDDELFKQRQKLYQSVMPAVANNLSKVFQKPVRSGRVFSSIDYENKGRERALEELVTAVREFWQGESDSGVDAHLRNRWFDLAKHDPNAFIAVDFSAFDPRTEKAKPYPVEFSSKEAINYTYVNGVLDWLITERTIQYKKRVNKNTQEVTYQYGSRYVMYLEDDAVDYTEVDPEDRLTDIPNPVFVEIKNRVFAVRVFNTKAKRVPAKRVGYEPDTITKGRTCVSIFHAALPFFMKELKTGSELDITMSLHAFPQKLQYANRCTGNKDKKIPPCRDGRTTNGEVCPACNGSGMSDVHTSAQDIILVPYPRPGEQLMDLDKLLIYKSPDISLIKFQDEYVDRLTEKARKAVFGGTTNIQKTGLKTATEADYAMDDTYDTLAPFASQYSAFWIFLVLQIATFTDNDEGIKLYHRFPNDFKLKNLEQLFAERKAAKDAGLPQHILDAIDIDIQEILYGDDKDTLLKIKIKSRFMPFSGKSSDEVQSIIASGKTTRYFEVLYNHFEIIFDEIDVLLGDAFYIKKYEQQKEIIRQKVDEIISELDKQKAKSSPLKIAIEPDENAAA